MFITLEGCHGCGKSTITQILAERLRQIGKEVAVVADQSATEFGRDVRRLNMESERYRPAPLTEALLIGAVRHQNVIELIKPGLASGKVVISERFNDALVAFQVFGRGLPPEFVENLGAVLAAGIEPNITLLLDIDPRIGLSRIPVSARHRFEREPIEFHDRVRMGYLSQAKRFSARCRIVDATKPANEVAENAWSLIANAISGG